MALYPKKEQKLWLLKVVSYPHGELVGFTLGDRSADTLKPLIESIEENYSPLLYCADDWKAFNKVIDPERLVQGKAVTHTVESHNASVRHWLGRFRRRTRIVSRSVQAVSESLKLIEYLHKRNGLQKLTANYLPLFC